MAHCSWRIRLGSLAGFFQYLLKKNIQEQIRGYVVSKCKEDEYEDIDIANSNLRKRFQMSLGHKIYLGKSKAIKGLNVKIWSSHVQRGIVIFCISAFKKVVLTICW